MKIKYHDAKLNIESFHETLQATSQTCEAIKLSMWREPN